MNANIYVVLKDGSFNKAFASVKRLAEEVSREAGVEVKASDIRKEVKGGSAFTVEVDGSKLEVQKAQLF